MKIECAATGEPAMTLQFTRRELPIFRALIERASFQDTRPDLQAAVFDLIGQLLQSVPDGAAPKSR